MEAESVSISRVEAPQPDDDAHAPQTAKVCEIPDGNRKPNRNANSACQDRKEGHQRAQRDSPHGDRLDARLLLPLLGSGKQWPHACIAYLTHGAPPMYRCAG